MPPSGNTLSTPWPFLSTSISSPSVRTSTDVLPPITMLALAMSPSSWVRRKAKTSRTSFSPIPASNSVLMTFSSSRSV